MKLPIAFKFSVNLGSMLYFTGRVMDLAVNCQWRLTSSAPGWVSAWK